MLDMECNLDGSHFTPISLFPQEGQKAFDFVQRIIPKNLHR